MKCVGVRRNGVRVRKGQAPLGGRGVPPILRLFRVVYMLHGLGLKMGGEGQGSGGNEERDDSSVRERVSDWVGRPLARLFHVVLINDRLNKRDNVRLL